MRLKIVRALLPTRRPFATSREIKTSVENVFLRVEADGVVGWGEASPLRYFGESAASVEKALQRLGDSLEPPTASTPSEISAVVEAARRKAELTPAAVCALDLALWDWVSRLSGRVIPLMLGRTGTPRWETLEGEIRARSFRTWGVTARDQWEAAWDSLEGCPRVKVKWSRDTDPSVLAFLRGRGVRDLLVDANAGLTLPEAEGFLPAWEAAGIAALEQPFPPERNGDAEAFRKLAPFPLIADESVRGPADLELAGPHFDAINIKLVKAGGLSGALRLAEAARAQGLRFMVGCMLESGLLIRAGACMAPEAEWVDLDGNLWLAADPALSDGQPLGWGVGLGSLPEAGNP